MRLICRDAEYNVILKCAVEIIVCFKYLSMIEKDACVRVNDSDFIVNYDCRLLRPQGRHRSHWVDVTIIA